MEELSRMTFLDLVPEFDLHSFREILASLAFMDFLYPSNITLNVISKLSSFLRKINLSFLLINV